MSCRKLLSITLLLLLPVMAGCNCGRSTQPAGSSPAPAAAAGPAGVELLTGDAGETLTARTTITSRGDDAREFVLADGTVVEMDEHTALRLDTAVRSGETWSFSLELQQGAIRLEVPPAAGTQLTVHTPVATAGVRGTDFSVSHSDSDGTAVDVYAGRVATSAAGQEKTLQRDESAVATRRGLLTGQIRAETRQRWATARTRLADRLIEHFQLDIDSDSDPDLRTVLQRLPAAARERARQRMTERLATRRQALRATLDDLADTIDRQAMTARERFTMARLARRQAESRQREERIGRISEAQLRWQRGLEELADSMARRGNPAAAERLRGAARRSEARRQQLPDTLAASATVLPEFTASVGPAEGAGAQPGERRLLASPTPVLPANHPLATAAHTLIYRVRIGPGGAVQEAMLVSSSAGRAESEAVTRLLRRWRFNADFNRRLEWRTLTIRSTPPR